jgi:3-oxoadipate enol-lactonase
MTAEVRFVALDDVTLRCRIDGAGNAPWLVFSNSLMTDLSLWDAQVAAFADRFRVLRYDQRGHGDSSIPAEDCRFDTLVADLAALFEHFDIRAASVVGVSMGGVTALGLAARYPERVARVAICDCQPASTPAGAAAWDERIALARGQGMDVLAEATVSRWFASQAAPARARIRAMVAATRLEGFVRAARALQNYDFRPDVDALRCETAFIVGASDAALPQVMRQVADQVDGASYRVIEGAGHLPNVEQPALFNEAIEQLLARPFTNRNGN